MFEVKYREERDKVWKDTLEDGTALFTGYSDVMREDDDEFGDTIENSDSTCLRKFVHQTRKPHKEFFERQLLYSESYGDFVKVCRITKLFHAEEQKSQEPCDTIMHVWSLSDDSVRTISSAKEFDDYQDFITLNLMIKYDEDEATDHLEIKHYLKDTFGATIGAALKADELMPTPLFNIFCYGRELKKDMYSSQALFVQNDAYLYVIEHVPQFVYRRFKSVYKHNTPNRNDVPNEIILTPAVDVFLLGFWTYRSAGYQNCYNLRYEVVVDGVSMLEDSEVAKNWEDEVYYRLKFRKPCRVEKGSKVLLRCWITYTDGWDDDFLTYWGDDGLRHYEINNEHKYIFKFENAPSYESDYQETWVMCGQFGEIFYTF